MVQGLERKLKFTEVDYNASSSFSSELIGAAASEIRIDYSQSNVGTPATGAQDGILKMLGTIEVEQFTQKRVQCSARGLYFLSALYAGGLGSANTGVGGSSDGNCSFSLPFGRMLNRAGLDATGIQAYVKGTFRPPAYYSSTAPTSITGKIRPSATTRETIPPGGLREPDWSEEDVRLDAVVNDRAYKIDIREDYVCPGLLLMALDENGTSTATDNSDRVDGLIRNVRVNIAIPGRGEIQYLDARWETLREETMRMAGLDNGQYAGMVGVTFLSFVARDNNGERNGLILPSGSSIILHFDLASDVADHYTSVTADSGTLCRVLKPFFLHRGAADAGSTRGPSASEQVPVTRGVRNNVRNVLARGGDRGDVRSTMGRRRG